MSGVSVTVLEITAIALIAGTLLDIGLSLYGNVRRCAYEASRRKAVLIAFREMAAANLVTARAEQERTELSWRGHRKFRVVERVPEGSSICSFILKPHDGGEIAPFRPGQHLTFQLRLPGENKPLVRCYSISNAASDRDHYRVTIKRRLESEEPVSDHPKGSSSYFHDVVKEGDILDLRSPGGVFYLDESAKRPAVFLAGGVGLTPFYSMLERVAVQESEREAWLFYAVSDSSHHIWADKLRALAMRRDNIHLRVVYSNPTEKCEQGLDYDIRGRIDRALLERELPSNNYQFYLCGPPPMMTALTDALVAWGVPRSDVMFEAFGAPAVKEFANTQVNLTQPTAEVSFANSGKTITWRPEDGTLLDLAEKHEIDLPSGCRSGSCGTCSTAITSGEVTYVAPPQMDPGAGSCLPCSAIPSGKLTLAA